MRLIESEVYHVFNRSIANFKIFNNESEFFRIQETIRYYQLEKPEIKLSRFFKQSKNDGYRIKSDFCPPNKAKIVEIIAYCFMPTHLHIVIKQTKENGMSIFMSNALNSYSRYFNIKHNRKGPLWEGRFKKVLVEDDEQLLHLTRYIHLNPVTAYLVENPRNWSASSYNEYISEMPEKDRFCQYSDILDINPGAYKSFVTDSISYQRELAKIKKLML